MVGYLSVPNAMQRYTIYMYRANKSKDKAPLSLKHYPMRITHQEFPDFRTERMALEDVFRNLPVWAANAAHNISLTAFRRGGWIDTSFVPWPKRHPANHSRGRALLVKTGQLRRSLRTAHGPNYFEIYTDVPYAQIHNEGGTITQTVTPKQRAFFWAKYYAALKARSATEASMYKGMALAKTLHIKIPKRQFMGKSELLDKRLVFHIERAIEAAIM